MKVIDHYSTRITQFSVFVHYKSDCSSSLFMDLFGFPRGLLSSSTYQNPYLPLKHVLNNTSVWIQQCFYDIGHNVFLCLNYFFPTHRGCPVSTSRCSWEEITTKWKRKQPIRWINAISWTAWRQSLCLDWINAYKWSILSVLLQKSPYLEMTGRQNKTSGFVWLYFFWYQKFKVFMMTLKFY